MEKRFGKFPIGARLHDTVQDDGGDIVPALKSAGAGVVQLTLPKFAACGEPEEGFSDWYLSRLKNAFGKAGVRIAALSCYINPLSDTAAQEAEKFKRYLGYAEKLGVGTVATETGSAVTDLRQYRQNRTEETFMRLLENLTPVMNCARQKGICVGIESVVYYPVYSARTLDRLCRTFLQNDIAAVFDPSNLLCAENCGRQRDILEEFVNMHARRIKIVHLKDVVIGRDGLTEERPLFEGILDVAFVIELLKRHGVQADIIVEAARSVENYRTIKQKLINMTEG